LADCQTISHDTQTYIRAYKKTRLGTNNYRGAQRRKITCKHTK